MTWGPGLVTFYRAGRSRARTGRSWVGSVEDISWSEGIGDGLAFSNSRRLRTRHAETHSATSASQARASIRTNARGGRLVRFGLSAS